MNKRFAQFSEWCSRVIGHPVTFALAIVSIIVWAAIGPFVAYSDTWQLFINTGTTILTFLMLFPLQASANRASEALHIKHDEVLRAIPEADDALRGIEKADEK